MAANPVTFTLAPRLGEGFWGWPENGGLAQPSNRAATFRREIINNKFAGNPRAPGEIDKLLSYEYQNNFIRDGVAGIEQ